MQRSLRYNRNRDILHGCSRVSQRRCCISPGCSLARRDTRQVLLLLPSHFLEITGWRAQRSRRASCDHRNSTASFLALPPSNSYDMRPGALGAHWVDETVLGTRASLDVASSPARLRLTDIKAADAGLYKCRVDFRRQPTKTTRVSLAVIGTC